MAPSTASSRLLAFHRDNAREYNELLGYFNILFYGQGPKAGALSLVFPSALLVDCGAETRAQIDEKVREYYGLSLETEGTRSVRSTLAEANALFASREESAFIVVLMNYNPLSLPLRGLPNLRIAVTMEQDFWKMAHEDLLEYNLVARDLTTCAGLRGKAPRPGQGDKVAQAMSVYECAGPRAQKIFRLLAKESLAERDVSLRRLFEREKKRLLIVSYSVFRNSLVEFYDHGVVSDKSGLCRIKLAKRDLLQLNEKINPAAG